MGMSHEPHGATAGAPRPVAALVVRSSEDDADVPVVPVLVGREGEPSGLGQAIWSLVQRDGYMTVIDTLERGGHWLVVTPDALTTQRAPGAGQDLVALDGYGLHYCADDTTWLRRSEAASVADQVWWYALEARGMLIEFRLHHERRPVGFVAWADPPPRWAELDAVAATDPPSS